MYKSASLREHTPEFAIYLFNRIVSSFKAAGFEILAVLSSFLFSKDLPSFLKGFSERLEGFTSPPRLFLSYEPPFEKDAVFLLPLFPPRAFILKNFYKDTRKFSIFTFRFKLKKSYEKQVDYIDINAGSNQSCCRNFTFQDVFDRKSWRGNFLYRIWFFKALVQRICRSFYRTITPHCCFVDCKKDYYV